MQDSISRITKKYHFNILKIQLPSHLFPPLAPASANPPGSLLAFTTTQLPNCRVTSTAADAFGNKEMFLGYIMDLFDQMQRQ
jgi:hypothetical protein